MTTTPHRQVGEVVNLVAPDSGAETLLELTAILAIRGRVLVFDGGRRFNPFRAAHYVRYYTHDQYPVVERIIVARIGSAKEIIPLLRKIPNSKDPLVIIDLLGAFNDKYIKPHIAYKYLHNTLIEFDRVKKSRPIFLGIAPQPKGERQGMQKIVMTRVTESFYQDSSKPPIQPHTLLKESYVPRNAPTATEMLNNAEAHLSRFIATVRPESREAFRSLIGGAKKHTDAIQDLNYINPFEAAELAMLLEIYILVRKLQDQNENQQDTITFLRDRIKELEQIAEGQVDG